MRILWVVAVLSVVACGNDFAAARPMGQSHCELRGGAVWAYSEVPGLHCATLESKFDDAVARMVAAGVASEERLNEAFEGIAIKVSGAELLEADDGEFVKGIYREGTRTITLSVDGRALLHELLHCWEHSQGVDDTGQHPHWTEKGYIQLDVAFSQKRDSLL